ncbi:MAG: heme-binding domain-containing protein [Flavobacteriales bacterium]|nr:heme-binding domain-containing protein [Flavobacteriales bacterium]
MKKVLYGLLIVFLIMQFFGIDKVNPKVDKNKDFITITQPSEEIQSILKASCYDCHSNETSYPWYSSIAPVSWILKHHIDEGREHINFSTFANYNQEQKEHALHECAEVLEKNEMPLKSYTLMHSEAKITEAQKKELINFFESIK